MGYQFIDLTDAQKLSRRTLLDTYGFVAQASAAIVLIGVQLYLVLQWLRKRQSSSDVPSSPSCQQAQKTGGLNGQAINLWWRRVEWWSGDSLIIFGTDYGTKGQNLAAVLWTIWLLALCFAETGNDYLHLAKRFGIVGSSQLPLHYLLIWKSSWSPIQTLTRASHETLYAYHQLLGRIVTFLVVVHAALYFNFYVQNNLLGNKLKEFYVLCGIVGALAFVAIGTTALAPVRQWSYRMFYVVHVALATALIPVLYFHVHHIRIYLYEMAAIYVLNTGIRWLSAHTFRGSIRSILNTSLVEITISIDSSNASKRLVRDLHPGQHAYVSLGGSSFTRIFRSNPFTVASIPGTDRHIKFVARALKGNTRQMLANAEKSTLNAKLDITIEGSYGINGLEDKLLQYDRVLFVAGGVGATFVVPLYRQLLADLSPGTGSCRRQKVNFVWISRTKAEVTWAVPHDQREKEGFAERLKICLTGVTAEGNGNAVNYEDDVEGTAEGDNEEGIELEEQKQLLSDLPRTKDYHAAGVNDLPIYTGRPDLRRLVQQAFSHGYSERVAIVACGRKSLSHDLRREIAPWAKRGREVWFHDERFSL